MDSISRNPSDFSPTTHAKQQRKHRNIDWDAVADAIQEGEVKQSHKDDCVIFVHDCGYTDPVGVVANVVEGAILTIEFRH